MSKENDSDTSVTNVKLREINIKRGAMKGRLTKFSSYLNSFKKHPILNSVQVAELECRLSKIDSLYGAFDDLQAEAESLCGAVESQERERDLFENQYFELVALARTMLADARVPRGSMCVEEISAIHSGRQDFVRLPKIDLPTYSGDFKSWLEYRDQYISLIHDNNSISDINKFHYLRASLKGSAALIIQNLDFRAENYSIAWQLLSDRYDNTRLLIDNHLKALFDIESIPKESGESLRNMIDTINKNLRSLAALGQPTDHWDTLIIYIMTKKLDYMSNLKWEELRNDHSGFPTLEKFLKFLNNRADLLFTLQNNKNTNKINISQSHITTNTQKNKTFTVTASTSHHNKNVLSCALCKQSHQLFSCQLFRDLDVDTRIKKVNGFSSICKNCLRPGHTEKRCTLSHCKYCKEKHNTLLHKEKFSENTQSENIVLSTNIVQTSTQSHILLSTALVQVSDADGRHHIARLLLDNGSTSHFITQALCARLGLVTHSTKSAISGIGNHLTSSAESCNLTIKSRVGDYGVHLNCFILPSITQSLPSTYINTKQMHLPSGIHLADPTFNIPSSVDILVGAEIFWDVLGSKSINLGKQLPKLQETKLGWVVAGVIHQKPVVHHRNAELKQPSSCYFTQCDNAQLTRFWELESIPSKYCHSKEERFCEENFITNTQRDDEGRFVVTIPLKQSPEILGDSYTKARSQFLSLERRLQRNDKLKQKYFDFVSEYILLNHMTESSHTDESKSYYLPHHHVINDNSTTTDLRVVFNGSAPTSNGKSLNDIQCVGPVVQEDLFSILLRFRQHKYVVTGDVAKMYRAILVTPEQRSLQKILFRFDPSEPLKHYKLNTVTYGTASAPYLATKCLVSLADHCTNSEASESIKRDFYVDDYLSGGDTIDSVTEKCRIVSDVLKSAKFNLRKWQSNNSQILQYLITNQDIINTEKSLNLSEYQPGKTLGLIWNTVSDTFMFNIEQQSITKITKRHILSLTSQVFDPLGIIGPCIVQAKLIMQKLWRHQCGWDDEVPLEIKKEFIDFMNSLSLLNSLRIPRWVSSSSTAMLDLHIFTDASELAYGTCVYVRAVTDNNVYVHLLTSKNKVAPIKPTTIPRLELSAALLGSRLFTKVKHSLTVQFTRYFFWSDSMIVLGWLNTSSNKLKHFVRNRVNEIQETTSGCRWSYVPSNDNPADLASRGLKTDSIRESKLWWSGPSFLQNRDITMPKVTNTSVKQLPDISLHTTTYTDNKHNLLYTLIYKSSNYTKLIRIVAYIKRFINNCKTSSIKIQSNLNNDELKAAESVILNLCQQEMFPKEYNTLKSNQPLHRKNRLISLSPFIDANNIIRVGGRLSNSYYSYNIKHPILLCSKHHITKLIVRMFHINSLHAGPQLLLANLRLNYWILNGRNLTKITVKKCVKCFRFNSQQYQPNMAPLPPSRSQLEYCFQHTGIDYCGPLLIVDRKGRGGRLTKSYICVFMCFAVKALHLELVTDLTKECFLAALNRFMSRRGKPATIHSDNGTSFVGASNDIKRMLDTCSNDINQQGIQFKFIPPYTPHFGGLWESAVKSVKYHLRRILSLAHLTYEEMVTCLVQIEAILNSRPLTPLSSDPSDLSYLSPAYFLIGRPLTTIPCYQIPDGNINRLQRHERIEKMRQHFWQRYTNEYVSTLQQKTKWQSSEGQPLNIGAMVIIKDKTQPPLLWLLGRIIKLSGSDAARVAEIRTKKGIIVRAYNNICPLPTC